MSGHSKWSTIKRKKGVKDQARGALFSKLSRAITLAVTEGGGLPDPDKNVKLRMAVEKARAENMPKNNIERAITKGSGPERESLKEIIYEAFGPGGVNLLIQVATDNPNRTLSEVKNIVERNGGKFGAQGSVAYLFKKSAVVVFDRSQEEEVFKFGEEVGAYDIEEDGDSYSVYFPFEEAGHVKDRGVEIVYKPQNSVVINTQQDATKVLKLIENLEGQDDVQTVFANFEIPDNLVE